MSETNFPVRVYHPAAEDPAERERLFQIFLSRLGGKTLIAHNQEQLDGLVKVGWKVKE